MITLDGIDLPPDLRWRDEVEWTPVASQLEYGVTGAGFIDASTKKTGRPITLQGTEETCWCTRGEVLALQALAAEPAKKITLNYHGKTMTVIFAPGKKPFVAASLWDEWPENDDDIWVLTEINFIEIK